MPARELNELWNLFLADCHMNRGRDGTAGLLCPQDLVDQHLREHKETPAMQAVMGGTFAQQIICKSVPYRSEKEEDFYQVCILPALHVQRSC